MINLLVALALGLCAFNAIQWVREASLRRDIEKLTRQGVEKDQTIQALQNAVKKSEDEIIRMDKRIVELKEIQKTNETENFNLRRSLRKSETENETAKAQIDEYKKAVATQNENILKQNESIKEQNELLKNVAGDRDEFVRKYKELLGQWNDLVAKHNELIKLVEQLRADAAKAPASVTK
ncbi:MAG: hypothetical protein HY043_03220 [Verrucomicrobia bacterium]|nr:hypothetical protein [Verrucomicrobiota bacterium]